MSNSLLVRLLPNLGPVSQGERLRASVGALTGVLLTGVVTQAALGPSGELPLLVAPMGASAVLLFAAPSSPLAQPWSILGGNVSAALIGITCRLWLPDPHLAAAVAVGLAIAAMFALRCLHPPGGAVALTAALGGPAVVEAGYGFALHPVALNSALLLLAALAFNNLTGRRYPHLRPLPAPNPHRTSDPVPAARVGFTPADLDAVLTRYGEVLPVDRDDLQALLHEAEIQAYRRRSGGLTCADIMSRDVAHVTAQTRLLDAWALLARHRIKVLPVVDGERRVVGVVTQTDLVGAVGRRSVERSFGSLGRLGVALDAGWSRRARVGDLMTAPAQVAGEAMTIAELVPAMAEAGLHHLPVVNGERRLVGVVTQSDLIAALFYGAAVSERDAPAAAAA